MVAQFRLITFKEFVMKSSVLCNSETNALIAQQDLIKSLVDTIYRRTLREILPDLT